MSEKAIIVIDESVLNDIRNTQISILKKLENREKDVSDDKYVSRRTAAQLLDCDDQTIMNFEKEGLIKRYGRGKFIRYSLKELKAALTA